jgi:hypothetical protein
MIVNHVRLLANDRQACSRDLLNRFPGCIFIMGGMASNRIIIESFHLGITSNII